MQENTDMKSTENASTIYILPTKQNNLKKQDFNSDTIHKTAKMFFYAKKMTGNRHKKHLGFEHAEFHLHTYCTYTYLLPAKHIKEPKV